ncbi:MAG: hypothetical protein BWY70_01187 [Bacteroidetes bacterium ADurb.Bin408]|nr:MAG: hypothetical protein BWY70_01187 [Bacteroidetes bacterium ADurb.Bin408]
MIGIWDIDAVEFPKDTHGGIAPDNDIVSFIRNNRYTCEIGSHTRGIAPACGITAGFFNAETAGADKCHVVGCTLLYRRSGNDHFFALDVTFLKFHIQIDFFGAGDFNFANKSIFVTKKTYFKALPAQEYFIEAEIAVDIGDAAVKGLGIEEDDIGAGQGDFGVLVDNSPPNALGKFLCKNKMRGEKNHKKKEKTGFP